jgi:hypothetical protein
MQYQIVSLDGVHLAGDFQGWNPGSTAMNPPSTGSVWELTVDIPATTVIHYKFINGISWGLDELVYGACGDGTGNRIYTVPSNNVILPIVCFGSCLACVLPQVDITLRVDMSNEIISPLGVFVQGSFQNPAWSGQQMTPIGNNVYSITVQMGEGSIQEYKFLNGTIYETVPPACGYGGYSNRYLTVPSQPTTLPLVCFGSCESCTTSTVVDVTFMVDMSETTVSAEGVHIAGGFQGWNPGSTLMTDLGNGKWSYTTLLLSGSYQEYKFINGITWDNAEQVPWYCANNGNRFLTVPQNEAILPSVCFSSCLVCNPPQVNVTFSVDMSEQVVSPLGVHLAGSFQGWNSAGTPMTDIGNGIWEVTQVMGEGELHEYKFINGDDFLNAEVVPSPCANYDGNREFFVPSGGTSLDLVCFGNCDLCQFTLYSFDLKVFLEGPFNGSSMNTSVFDQGLLPVNQPFNVAPWNYDGQEAITALPGSGIVDWVYLELRETDGDASTATPDKMIDHQAAVVLSDGSIVRPDGTSPVLYTGNITQNLYLIVHHRNHLAVMTAAPLISNDGPFVYDFTTIQSYQNGQKPINGGTFVMIGGDSDANGIVNNLDKTQWNSNAGESGYLNSDNNLNGQSDNVDKNNLWDVNLNATSKVPL